MSRFGSSAASSSSFAAISLAFSSRTSEPEPDDAVLQQSVENTADQCRFGHCCAPVCMWYCVIAWCRIYRSRRGRTARVRRRQSAASVARRLLRVSTSSPRLRPTGVLAHRRMRASKRLLSAIGCRRPAAFVTGDDAQRHRHASARLSRTRRCGEPGHGVDAPARVRSMRRSRAAAADVAQVLSDDWHARVAAVWALPIQRSEAGRRCDSTLSSLNEADDAAATLRGIRRRDSRVSSRRRARLRAPPCALGLQSSCSFARATIELASALRNLGRRRRHRLLTESAMPTSSPSCRRDPRPRVTSADRPDAGAARALERPRRSTPRYAARRAVLCGGARDETLLTPETAPVRETRSRSSLDYLWSCP